MGNAALTNQGAGLTITHAQILRIAHVACIVRDSLVPRTRLGPRYISIGAGACIEERRLAMAEDRHGKCRNATR